VFIKLYQFIGWQGYSRFLHYIFFPFFDYLQLSTSSMCKHVSKSFILLWFNQWHFCFSILLKALSFWWLKSILSCWIMIIWQSDCILAGCSLFYASLQYWSGGGYWGWPDWIFKNPNTQSRPGSFCFLTFFPSSALVRMQLLTYWDIFIELADTSYRCSIWGGQHHTVAPFIYWQ
jgi:hypothetical protein